MSIVIHGYFHFLPMKSPNNLVLRRPSFSSGPGRLPADKPVSVIFVPS